VAVRSSLLFHLMSPCLHAQPPRDGRRRLRDGYVNGLVLIDAQLRRHQPTEDVDSNRSRVGESMPSIVETLIFSIAPWNGANGPSTSRTTSPTRNTGGPRANNGNSKCVNYPRALGPSRSVRPRRTACSHMHAGIEPCHDGRRRCAYGPS